MWTIISKLSWRRYLPRNTYPWHELNAFPGSTPEEQRRILATKLFAQVCYFGNREDALPEWREAARLPNADELWKVWPTMPIITKRQLRERFPAQEIERRFRLEGKLTSTGGSTGEPTVFFHDRAMQLACVGADIFSRIQMGWKPGMPTIIIWGSERDIGRKIPAKLKLLQKSLNEFWLDGYDLSDETIERVLRVVHGNRGLAMFGFTSMLESVARRIVQSRRNVPPGRVRTAWNGGEMLFPQQIEIFRKVFGVPILNRYGGRELGAMACQDGEDSPLWVLRPWVHLEIVDDQGRPSSPGEPGRIICTSTICRGTPFLRYEIEDAGVYEPAHLDEAGIGAISRVEGRIAGMLELPDGRRINCIFWNHLFKEFGEIHQFQVILQADSRILILLTGAGLTQDRDAQIRNILSHFLGRISFQIEWVPQIRRTALGKLVQVVREQSVHEGVFARPSAP
jgi:phenylacetate-CoA ligase